jgi:hypothetical protein
MIQNLSFEDADGYLLIRYEGKWEPEAVHEAILRAVKEAETRGYNRSLWDIRGLSAPVTDLDRFLAGEQIAQTTGGKLRIAAVYPSEFINKFAENTAINRGAQFVVLPDFEAALKWLMHSQ